LHLDPRATEILLNALVSFDTLQMDSPIHYENTRSTSLHLVDGKPQSLSFMLKLFIQGKQAVNMLDLAEAVKSGGTIHERNAETPNHEFWETFAKVTGPATVDQAISMTDAVSDFVNSRKGEAKILDIACGSGGYGYTFSERFPKAHVTLLDYPNVIPFTKSNMKDYKVKESQISFLEADLFVNNLGGPYDLIIASNIYHHFNNSRSIELNQRLNKVLTPGGKVIVNDFVTSDGPPTLWESPFPRSFSLVMLAWSKSGKSYSESDFKHIFINSGFDIDSIKHNFPFPNSFVIATKK